MTDTEIRRIKAICEVARVKDIGELSDGFHTFNSLYEQRMILFAALVKAYKDKAWKSYRHEDGEYCFGGGWFIVGIDTPEGSYTYHYENKYWDMFDCIDLPRAKHWDGHTEADAETRLMSLPERKTYGDTISRQAAIDAIVNWAEVHNEELDGDDCIMILQEISPAQPEQSSEIQGILDYLDTVLHPIVSPEHWDVYSELHDMISRLLSAQFEPNCKGCKHQPRFSHEEPCCTCANNYENKYER